MNIKNYIIDIYIKSYKQKYMNIWKKEYLYN